VKIHCDETLMGKFIVIFSNWKIHCDKILMGKFIVIKL